MQVEGKITLPDPDDPQYRETLERNLHRWSQRVADVIKNALTFTDNMEVSTVNIADTGSADTEFSVAHTLKKVPTRFRVNNISVGGSVYDSGTAWTATTIYLKCTAANADLDLDVLP